MPDSRTLCVSAMVQYYSWRRKLARTNYLSRRKNLEMLFAELGVSSGAFAHEQSLKSWENYKDGGHIDNGEESTAQHKGIREEEPGSEG